MTDLIIEPGTGAALPVRRGEVIDVEQTLGRQGADLLVFGLDDRGERFHAARSRSLHGTAPTVGTVLWSCPPAERPLMSIVADSAPGHDLLYPACTALESELASGVAGHTNCHDIQFAALLPWGIDHGELHDPLNLWMAGGAGPDGAMWWRHTPTVAGDRVSLVAHADVLVAVNPCGSDLFGSWGFRVRSLRARVRPANGAEQRRLLPARPRPDAAGLRYDPGVPARFDVDGLRRVTLRVDVKESVARAVRELAADGQLGADDDEVMRALVMTWWQERHLRPAARAYGRSA